MSKRLRAAREEARFTQQQLAAVLGVHLKTVNNYENPNYAGARKSYVVKAWAEVCGRDFEDCWGASQHGISRTGWLRQSAELASAS